MPSEHLSMRSRLLIAAGWGILIGGITLQIEHFAQISRNPGIAAIQVACFAAMSPGIVGAMAMSGNVHAWYLGCAAGINALFHFGVSWLLLPLLARLKNFLR